VNEPLWQQAVITLGTSIKLVVEVVSTNWQNDYTRKVEDYAVLGVPEYWIVGYLGIRENLLAKLNSQQLPFVLCLKMSIKTIVPKRRSAHFFNFSRPATNSKAGLCSKSKLWLKLGCGGWNYSA